MKSKFRISKNKLLFYLVVIIILNFVSIYTILTSFPKDKVIKSSKKIRPPKNYYRNKKPVVNDNDLHNDIDDNDDDLFSDESMDNNKIMIENFRKFFMNTIESVDDSNNINLLREKTEIHRMIWEQLFGTDDYSYKHVLNTLLKYQEENLPLVNLFYKVHKNLYPWIYGKKFLAIDELIKTYNGRGIVICTGSLHFKYAKSTIDTLKYLIKTRLPIEVFYYGDDDLSARERDILLSYPNVYISNIEDYFNTDVIQCKKRSIKPYAMLASRFMEVILIDADSLFIRDPDELFYSDGYEETGTFFFRDRTLKGTSGNDSLQWFKEWAKDPLPETRSSRFWNGITVHEMDSSAVVINKEKALLGLLAACKLNELEVRENMVYRHIDGEKETFWMGFDMARQHYYMNEQPISFIGSIRNESTLDNKGSSNNKSMICGHIAHTMEDGRVLYWNGHLVADKDDDSSTLLDFESYIMESDSDNNKKWTNSSPLCYYINDDDEIIQLYNEEKNLIDVIKERAFNDNILVS